MKIFKDKHKKDWTIELTVGSARRVKAETEIDLINAISLGNDGASISEIEKLINDPFKLVDVLFALCRDQAEKDSVSGEQFAELFDADAIEAAANALVEELINFSPAAKRKALMKLYQTAQRIAAKNEAELEKILESDDLEPQIEEALKKSFIDSPESSESVRIPLHSDK
jgi:hypothetical protein